MGEYELEVISGDLVGQIFYVPRAIILTIVFVLVNFFIEDRNILQFRSRLKYLLNHPWTIAFLFWLAFILTSTLVGRYHQTPYLNIFDDFGLFNENGWNMEMIENTLLFIPYTFNYTQAFKPTKPWKASILLSLFSSAFIEFFQLLFWLGCFQFSDLVHNCLGGLIGCLLWSVAKKTQSIFNKE